MADTPTEAVLLVGGRGTRMWPLTSDTPKALLPLAGVPFVEYQLRQLAGVGVERVVLAVAAEEEAAWRDYAEGGFPGLSLEVEAESEPLDTAGQVRAIAETNGGRFLVLNGDVVLLADLSRLGAADWPGVLALVELEDVTGYGVVVITESGGVEAFVEKPDAAEAPAKTISAGVYVLDFTALRRFEPGRLSFERTVFPELASDGSLGAVVLDGRWIDIGTPSLYLEAHDSVFGGEIDLYQPSDTHVAEGAEVNGSLAGKWAWVGPGARIDAGATVGEAVVMPGAVIEEGTIVRRAVVGANARVGRDSIITGATLVGPGAVIGPQCEIDRGARIAPYAQLSAGSVTFSPPS